MSGNDTSAKQVAASHGKAKLLAALLVVLIALLWSVSYVLPNGSTLGFFAFVALWSRELAILLFVAIAVVVGLYRRSRS